MASNSPLLRAAQITSISTALVCSGVSLAESFLLVPRLLESPVPLMLRQWRATFETGKRFFRATAFPTAAVFYLLAWHRFHHGSSVAAGWKLFLAAGVLSSSVGPYTWVVVMPTIRELLRREEEEMQVVRGEVVREEVVEQVVRVQREESAKWLVDHWGILSLPRAVVLGVAGVLGLVAAL